MAIPNPVTYADITAKIAEVDQDLAAYQLRQDDFVNDLNDMISYFIYNLQDVQVAAAIAAAAAAGDIDPGEGQAIYQKFMEVQQALRTANSDADKLAIFDTLRQFQPVLRKLPIGDPAYNGLPPQPLVVPGGYPVGPPAPFVRRGPGGGPAAGPGGGPAAGPGGGPGGGPAAGPGGGPGGGPAAAPVFPVAPTGAIAPRPIALSDADAARVDAIAAEAEGEPNVDQKPIITTRGNRRARVTDVFRDPATGAVTGFQVLILNAAAGGPDVYRRIDIQAGGRRSRRNRKSKKRGGYKLRKSRRRTFR
jgi:hypothetical protein